MRVIELNLDDDELLIMRSQARMMQIMLPETNEMIDKYIAKILEATGDISMDMRKEIGKMQRAARRVKETLAYGLFIQSMQNIEKMMVAEMQKEDGN